MRKLSIAAISTVLVVLYAGALHAADKPVLGKLFIKAGSSEVGNQQFLDPHLDDSVKDMKNRNDKHTFIVVANESDADFLITIIERHDVQTSGGHNAAMTATLSVRDGTLWKPGIKISEGSVAGFPRAAQNVLKAAEKWIIANKAR